MTRCLCLMLVLAGCAPSTPPRGEGPGRIVPGASVERVEVTSDEAAAIRRRTPYAGSFMRYHAFVTDTDTVEFWHDGKLLATIDDQGVIRYMPVVLSMAPGAAAERNAKSGVAKSGVASFDDLPPRAILGAEHCRARSKEVPCVLSGLSSPS